RVVGVLQILQAAGLALGRGIRRGDGRRTRLWVVAVFGEGRAASCVEAGQPEGQRVVVIERAGVVLIVDALALALGVVVDVGDADRRRRLVIRVEETGGSASRCSHTSTRSSKLASLNTGWTTLRLARARLLCGATD